MGEQPDLAARLRVNDIPHLRAPRATVERRITDDGYAEMVVDVMCGRPNVAVTLTTYVPSKVRCPECKSAERRHTCDTRRSGGGAAVIHVERARVYPSVARRGAAWKWVYNCVGPDGRRFDNDSIVTLRDVLRRAYPGVEIVEPWKVG